MERGGGRAVYQQIADSVREQIRDGSLRPGDQIPSETQLREAFGVSRQTARAAVGALVSDRLVRTEQGRGTFVIDPRDTPMPTRMSIAYSRTRRHEAGDAFSKELADFGRDGKERIVVDEIPASPEIADRLGIDAGDPVVRRRRLQTVSGRPYGLADSYYRPEQVAGSEIVSPESVERGTDVVMEELGLEALTRRDEITARMPTPAEAQELEIAGGVPVVIVVSSEIAEGGEVVEVFVQVRPASECVLVYDVDKSA